jgi:hypothetical protein
MNVGIENWDIERILNASKQKPVENYEGHCSAIIKLLPDGSDLMVGHNTWIGYEYMLRIVKKFNFHFKNIPGNTVSFSSYPGCIFSADDFYLISSGLFVMETTFGVFNTSLYESIDIENFVFEFIRNLVANRLSRNGKEWTDIFQKQNSGTLNNQFMILDYNKFRPGTKASDLPNDTLWVCEQMTSYMIAEDVTHILREQGYWASYNIPYFPFIYKISGYLDQFEKVGDFLSYENTPRAKIFRRDQNRIKDMTTLYKLMQYNDFKNDPLSKCDKCIPPYSAANAIAARNELNDPNGTYPIHQQSFRAVGSIDTKITNSSLFKNFEMIANSGPTHEQQPIFQWSKSIISSVKHNGQPDIWNFSTYKIKWSPNEFEFFRK